MVEEVSSGAHERLQRRELLRTARRRTINAIMVWRLDRWGWSVADLVGTLYELQALGVGFIFLYSDSRSSGSLTVNFPAFAV